MDPKLGSSPGEATSGGASMTDSQPAEAPFPPPGDQTIWVDGTSFFAAVCDELKVGELVHGENFSLFEAMSALEIMDPKMDAGMTSLGHNTLDEAIVKGAAPLVLTIPQLVDIMDHLLSCEATWHKGHSLAQTVFSCLYMLKLDRTVPNALLHAYCKVSRATCTLVRAAVSLSDIHEEEDFVTSGYGLPLEGEGDSKCLATLNAVEEQLARQLRGCKGSATAKKKLTEEVEPLQNNPVLEESFCESVLCRLRFRKALYHTLAYMDKPLGRGADMAQKHIVKALAEISAMRSSSEFLSSLKGRQEPVNTASTASGQPALGFDENVNGRLLAPTPPRSINILSWIETLNYFEHLLNDLHRLCTLSTDINLEDLFLFVVDFQKSHPDIVARAYLQLLLFQDGKILGRELVTNALYRTIKLHIKPPSPNSETHNFITQTGNVVFLATFFLILEHLGSFQQSLANPNVLITMCTNPAWQRRKLGRVILEWGILLEQAEATRESSMQTRSSGGQLEKTGWTDDVVMGWAAEQLCWIVTHYLLLGFELELYSLNEYSMVYWYLDHGLVSTLHYKMAKERRLLELEHLKSAAEAASDSAKKKGKKKKGGPVKAAINKEIRFSPGARLLQCYSALSKGFVWMLAALKADHKIIHRETNFNSELERFMQRFELLHRVVVPEPMTYIDYREGMSFKHQSIKELYQAAYDHFMSVQQLVQGLAQATAKASQMETVSKSQRAIDIRQLEQVALRNRVALQIAHQAGPGDNLRVTFEFSQHPCFAVAVIKKP